jgi:hypothetical protein
VDPEEGTLAGSAATNTPDMVPAAMTEDEPATDPAAADLEDDSDAAV